MRLTEAARRRRMLVRAGRRGHSSLLLTLFVVSLLAIAAAAPPPTQAASAPPIRHVGGFNLENYGFCQTPATEPTAPPVCPTPASAHDPAYTSLLFPEGTLIANYYGIGHESLDNYIAEVSGQAPNPETQDDCASGWGTELSPGTADAPQEQAIGQGCNFPARVKTIADQLQTEGLSWKGYEEDMGNNLVQDGG